MKRNRFPKITERHCSHCQQTRPNSEFTRCPGRWCDVCEQNHLKSLEPRDVRTMTRDEIRKVLTHLLWERSGQWSAIGGEECILCMYTPDLEITEFERQLHQEWQRQGGCQPDIIARDLEEEKFLTEQLLGNASGWQ